MHQNIIIDFKTIKQVFFCPKGCCDFQRQSTCCGRKFFLQRRPGDNSIYSKVIGFREKQLLKQNKFNQVQEKCETRFNAMLFSPKEGRKNEMKNALLL